MNPGGLLCAVVALWAMLTLGLRHDTWWPVAVTLALLAAAALWTVAVRVRRRRQHRAALRAWREVTQTRTVGPRR